MSLQKLSAQFGFDVDARSVDAAIRSVNSIDREIGSVMRGASKFMGLFAAGGVGAAVFSFANQAVNAFAEEERAIAKLNNALLNLGITDKNVAADMVAFSLATSLQVKATQEEILALQTSLVQRGLYGEELKKATQASLDLSTKTGNLATAGELVGKAYQGVTKGLNTVGVIIDRDTPKAQVYAETMRQLGEMYGGAAVAEMDTYAGRLELVNKRFGELQETLGEHLLPYFERAVKWGEQFATVLETINRTAGLSGSEIDRLRQRVEDLTQYKTGNMSSVEAMLKGFPRPNQTAFIERDLNQAKLDLAAALAAQPKGGSAAANRKTGAGAGGDDDAERVKAAKLAAKERIDALADEAEERTKLAEEEANIAAYWLGETGQRYTRFFGAQEIQRRNNRVLALTDHRLMAAAHKAMLADLEAEYRAAAQTISGGWRQAIDGLTQAGVNFTDAFSGAINGAMGPATSAIQEFFTKSSKNFLDLESLAKKVFQGILDAFLQMIAQIMARKLILGIFGSAFMGPAAFAGPGFSKGGYTGDGDENEVAGIVHRGEFVLDASTTKALRAGGSAPVGTFAPALGGASGRGGASIVNNITLNGGASDSDIGALCEKITAATRAGLRQAGEMANVVSKVGAKKAGITGL